MTEFAKKLAYYRKLAGLNQTTLGKKVGVTSTQVSKYERGLAVPRPEVLKRIADALEISVDLLMSLQDKPSKDKVREVIESIARISITASRLKNNGSSTKYMDCYLSPEVDKDFINEAKDFFYNYIRNRFGDDYDMTQVLKEYNLVDIKLVYNFLDYDD